MRIQAFHIEGFGHFASRTVGPLERPVTIFHGPNEAGKSTYMEFLRTVLFGFPPRLGHRHYPPLAGGHHGGSITMVDEAGDSYVARRRQGRGTGPVTITNAAEEALDETVLARLLGHHTKDVFQSVFAFTLNELHSDALLKDSSVNNQIYSAGMRLTKLPVARRMLKLEKDGTVSQRRQKAQAHTACQGTGQDQVRSRRGREQRLGVWKPDCRSRSGRGQD